MKQKLLKTLVLLCALIVGSISSWAETTTYQHVFNAKPNTGSNVVLSSVKWNVEATNLNGYNSANYAGVQIGSSKNNGSITLTSSSAWGEESGTTYEGKTKITEVRLWLNLGGTSVTPTVTIGGKQATSDGTTVKKNSTAGSDWTKATKVTFTPADGGDKGQVVINVATVKAGYICCVEIDCETPPAAAAVETPVFNVGTGTYTAVQNVTITCATTGTTIYYTTDGTEPTSSSSVYSTPVAINESCTLKAIAIKGEDASNVATATYTIFPVHHAGTVEDPYTVADARNAIDANTGLTDVYVSGIVFEGGSSLSSGAMNYWISDDGLETDKFYIYKGKGLSGADFSATSDVQVGDVVVVYGTIMKFDNTIYEFKAGSQLSSLVRPAVPRILTTPATISELEYVTGNGPSAAQTFTVSGSNLTADITLALSGTDFEMSLSEGSGYTNSLTLTQTEGAVAETTVYVRLKEGLEINDYAGTITLTSADATTKTINLSGNVTPTLFTWDLSTDSYDANPTEETISWTNAIAVMENNRNGDNTAVNNYIPTTQSSTRFYKNNILTISPTSGYMITRVVFTAKSENYASNLKNSTWTNATAEVSGMTVTVTPTDGASAITATIGGTCGFTAVKVYYQTATATINIAAACTDGDKCYGTYSNSKAFIVPADLTVYEVSVNEDALRLAAYATGDIVPANTGVLVAGDAGDHNVVLTTGGTSKLGADNMLRATGAGIDAAAMSEADANCKFYRLTMHGGTQIGFFWGAEKGAAFAVPANKAYLAVPNAEAGAVKGFRFGENTDGISEIMSNGENEKMSAIYDLSGRRVVKPTKGLYIVNGKKVVK